MDADRRLEYIDVDLERLDAEWRRATIRTSEGDIYGIYHPAVGKASIIWVCGASGGTSGPSLGIYDDLCRDLMTEGVSSLQIDYRYPGEFSECVQDALNCSHHTQHFGDAKRMAPAWKPSRATRHGG